MRATSESNRVANWLKRHGVQDIAALVIDVAGPFRFLGAQAMYVLQPLLGAGVNFAQDMAVILEDPEKVDALLMELREVKEQND
jgi:hypothetical protein